MKKAKALNCASTLVRLNMPFTAATSGSMIEVMNPHAKNNVVTDRKAVRVLALCMASLLADLAFGASGARPASGRNCGCHWSEGGEAR